ncbi:MAG TPA: CPBP family glutamic-type intramembrane protease [Candidatus Sulfotelmatobacter sp.]|nr:CPBP family glutamic-type intramembrane protease [Candidatus Sulfotelmatobacter sp.]
MADARLTGSEKRALILWVIFGALGLLFAQRYFFRAFPEASVDFKVSRTEAQLRARNFVQGLGENVDGYQSTITFDVDENGKTYLERELGLQEANRLMSSELNIWFWDVRFFKPQQEEEYTVRVSPAGKVVAYSHKIEEARGARSLSREEALSAAQQFLQAKVGTNLDNWNFLPEEANSETRPNRLDWSFTWERKNFKAKDAPYRLEVGLQGDRIGSTQEYLQVPEAWTRNYKHLRSTNIFYNQVALIPYGFLLGAALWLGITLMRQDRTSWGAALKLGALVAVLYFLMQANDWNSIRAGYDTHQAYSSFVTGQLAKLLVEALATGLMVTLVLPGGEPLYRSTQPARLRLYQAFSRRGIRSKEFFNSSVVGISMAAAHMGFIVAFYMIGSKFGVWAPQDLSYSDVVNTSFPWIAGVAVGVMAATSEEFLFRLFAIPFLEKMTGSRMLAVILPAFFWSFLHSAYPQEPGYIRGIEVGLVGILAGVVMLRWGILATLIWHYTVDASLVGMLLIRSDNLYFKISGIVVGLAAVAPLAWSGISYLARGSFETVDDLMNGAEPVGEISLERRPAATETALTARRYDPLATGTIGFLALCVVLGGVLAVAIHREKIGDYLHLTVNNRMVASRADAVMLEHGLDPKSFRKAAQFVDTTNPVANEYLRRRLSVAQINQIYAERVPGALWRVRYFRDSQPEEFAIILKPDGSLHAYRHTLAEAAKGANLSKEEAQSIAEKFLREQKQIDLSAWKLVEANSDKRPNRTDHTLTWQQIAPLDPQNGGANESADHGFVRMDVQVLGDEPANYRTYLKIPEEFTRKQEEISLPRMLFALAKYAVVLAVAVCILVFYFLRLRTQPSGTVPWRRLALWGLGGCIAFLGSLLLGKGIPALLAQYPTAVSLKLFLATTAVGFVIIAAVVAGGLTLLFGLAWSFGARAFGSERIPTWTGMPADYYRDAFWIAVGGAGALIGVRRLLTMADTWWPTLHRELPASFGDTFDALYPAAGIIGGAIVRGLLLTGTFALAAAYLGAELRVRWLRLALFVALAASLVSDWGSPGDFAKQFLMSVVILGVIVFGFRWVVRFNLLGCFLMAAGVAMLGGAVELTSQPDGFYRSQGYLVVAALVILLTWPLVAWRMATRESASA